MPIAESVALGEDVVVHHPSLVKPLRLPHRRPDAHRKLCRDPKARGHRGACKISSRSSAKA
jgi:hypothetical protein